MATTTDRGPSTSPTGGDAPVGPEPRTRRSLSRAWVSIALVPAFFAVSFVVQTGIYAWTGYDPSAGDVPLSASLAAAVPGLAIVLVPCVAAVFYGLRASREGDRTGGIPAGFGALLAIGATVLTLLNL